MATDHHTVGDAEFKRLHQRFIEEELVELCIDVGQFIGMGKTFAVLDAMNETCIIPNLATA